MRAVDVCAVPSNPSSRNRDALKGLQNAQPCSIAFPTSDSGVAGAPGTVTFGNVAPGCTEVDALEDTVDNAVVICIGVVALRGAGGRSTGHP